MGELIKVKGRPERLDAVIRPVSFAALLVVGLAVGALLAWAGWWFWVPVPAAALLLAHQLVFSLRGDRPISVTLQGSLLVVDDPKGGHHHEVDLGEVHTAAASFRRVERAGRDIAYFALYDVGARPLLALRVSVPARGWPSHAADLEAIQPVLGGNAGVLRGLAPPGRLARQLLSDDEGALTRALLDRIKPQAYTRVALRAWTGEAPPVDFMGLHQGPPDVHLVLQDSPDGPTVQVLPGRGPASPAEPHTLPITGAQGGRASRILTLLSLPGQDDRHARLPVLVWHLADGVDLAIPAPLAGHHGEPLELGGTTQHTHLAEGANATWWLLHHLERVPDGLRQAISDARVATPQLHPTLARHLPDGDGAL